MIVFKRFKPIYLEIMNIQNITFIYILKNIDTVLAIKMLDRFAISSKFYE